MVNNEKEICFDGMPLHIRDMTLSALMFYSYGENIKELHSKYRIACMIDMLSQSERFLNTKNDGTKYIKNFADIFQQQVMFAGGWTALKNMFLDKQQKNFRDDVRLRFANGLISGFILKHASRTKVSLQEAARAVAEGYHHNIHTIQKQGIALKMKAPQEDGMTANIWPRYKHMAHLWAALTEFEAGNILTQDFCFLRFDFLTPKQVVPAMPSFALFVEYTNKYRELAINFIPKNANKPLLDPHRAPRLKWDNGPYLKGIA